MRSGCSTNRPTFSDAMKAFSVAIKNKEELQGLTRAKASAIMKRKLREVGCLKPSRGVIDTALNEANIELASGKGRRGARNSYSRAVATAVLDIVKEIEADLGVGGKYGTTNGARKLLEQVASGEAAKTITTN